MIQIKENDTDWFMGLFLLSLITIITFFGIGATYFLWIWWFLTVMLFTTNGFTRWPL